MVDTASVAELRMRAVFDAVGMAAHLLREHDPAAIVRAWKHQMDFGHFFDPTLMLKVHAQKTDMDRKLRLLEAAAEFMAKVDQIRDEALERLEETQRGMEATENYGSEPC